MAAKWGQVVRVTFMCQFDWTIWCPDIWLNHILCVCLCGCVFLDEKNFSICKLSGTDCPPQCGVDLIQSVEGLHRRKGWVRNDAFSLLDFELGHQSTPAFGLELELEFLLSGLLLLKPLDLGWNYIISSLGSSLMTTNPRLLGLQNHVSQFLVIYTYLYTFNICTIHIYILLLLVLFLGRTRTNTDIEVFPMRIKSQHAKYGRVEKQEAPGSLTVNSLTAPNLETPPTRLSICEGEKMSLFPTLLHVRFSLTCSESIPGPHNYLTSLSLIFSATQSKTRGGEWP